MTARIDRLLAVLDAAGVRLTPAELAEAVWLALRVDVAGPSSAPAAGPRSGARAVVSGPGPAPSPPSRGEQVDLRLPVPPGKDPGPAAAAPEAGPPGDPGGPAAPGRGNAPAPDPDGGGGDGGLGLEAVPGWPLLVRTAGALPNSGQVLRALRPLKRRVRSGHRATIDEEATACQIAERRLWTPVWRPATDRWLHLTLVLDRSSVGGVWDRLGHEVRTLLERLGAFRTIRVVYLGLRPDGTMGLTARARLDGPNPPVAPRSPLGLTDRTGDHLVLVLSDCVSGPWHDGEMARVLKRWARRAPVAILQPLPERLWSRTGLDPVPGRLSALRAGAPSAESPFTSAWRRRGLPERTGPVPVLEIDPRWLRPWADLVAGRAVGGIDAIVTPAGVRDVDDVVGRPAAGRGPGGTRQPPVEPTPERRVREFRAAASAPAYRLARYLSAAVPLNLAVIRVVQAVMVPSARPSHLAEVLYGGLLVPVSLGGGAADEQHFEFRRGVRQALLGTLDRAEAGQVLAEVSSYVERHLERAGASFTAVVSAPVGSLTVPALRQPFAQIRAEVLRRLAGRAAPGDPEPAGGPGPSATAPGGGPRLGSAAAAAGHLTILQVSGSRLAGEGDPATGDPDGAGSASGPSGPELLDDLAAACHREGRAPDLVIVTGGAARRATPAEYQAAHRLLENLRTRLGLPTGRVIVVPGLSDVNEGRCLAHFLSRAADGAEPVPPYWPKWEPFAELTARLPGATAFQPHQPWQLLPVPAARTVVAALNSTMSVSHLPGERFGRLGHAQLEWFADRLRDYERRGWLRVGVLHHNPTDGADDTGLRDADAFARLLAAQLDVVLHDHPGGVREIGLTGVPAVGLHGADGLLPPDATHGTGTPGGYRYQLVDLRPGKLRVLPQSHARRGAAAGRDVSHAYGDHWWPPEVGDRDAGAAGAAGVDDLVDGSRTDLVARVARAYRARTPGAVLAEHRWPGAPPGAPRAGYLVVSPAGDHLSAPYLIGVFDGEPRAETVQRFLADVVRPDGPGRDAMLVCRSVPAHSGLRDRALGQGVRLVSFADFELGDDVLWYAEGQAALLADDPAFPAARYVPQPYVLFDPDSGASRAGDAGPAEPAPELLGRLRRWLAAPEGQMIAVVGASGTGKTFLLRELARRLHADRDPVVPILVDLRSLDWRVGLDELVAIHLSRGGLRRVDLDRSRYLLREGRVALLCDGLDELAARTTHDRLRDWVAGWEAGARIRPGRGKVVLVSRDADLLADALGPYSVGGPTGPVVRWVRLVGLDREQILEFLARRLGGPERARARLELLGRVGGLLRMARNPRMLAFIADIDEQRLRAAASGDGRVTVADLYRRLISEWLDGERRRGGADDVLGLTPLADLERAVTYLARRLWESGEAALGADALGAAADVLTRLTTARGGGASGRSETARLLGAGTLLVRDPAYRFHFVDRSVLEWLVAREVADQLDPDHPAGRVRGLLRREMSPLLVEFLCDLAGHDTARRWARAAVADPAAPVEVRVAARRVLDHLDRSGAGQGSPDQGGADGSPEPPAGRDRP
ncbi:SAV_2336 N-terminal domain-related protein [Micromonospora sp. NPDC048830]|uniref:SAV_2336 N-terminal domain-related protein n=1 Tax=Micromonospora sp. NPDC048830 TaxID=3364257 RepID=UPI00371B3EA3